LYHTYLQNTSKLSKSLPFNTLPYSKMNITDVLPVIVLFAVVEFAKGFAEGFFSSEAESTNPADLDVNTESSGQCAVVHRRKPQSQSSTKEESSCWIP
jgi:hypothetical protein